MKKNYLPKTFLIFTVAVTMSANSFSQVVKTESVTTVSEKELDSLRSAVEINPNDIESHREFLKVFSSADSAEGQYLKWMDKYPEAVSIPLAIAEKFGSYSPKRGKYLLRAAELQPGNSRIWQDLNLYASMSGDAEKQLEYMEKAIAADPENISLQYAYASLFKNVDETIWKEKVWAFVKKYPTESQTATALHLMGYDSEDLKEKISVWEKLRSMFPLEDIQVAINRLVDAYIRNDQDDKAIELATTMGNWAEKRLMFSEKLQLSKTLSEIDSKVKEGKFSEARNMVLTLNAESKHLFNVGSRIILLKAFLLDTTGATLSAYDSLIVFQSKTPDNKVKRALEEYGCKLNKGETEIANDLSIQIAKNSKPASPFELDSYTSDKKVKLEECKGKVVLISFWYPGCGPCRGEMPYIEKVVKKYGKDKLAYFGINGVREQDGFVVPFINASKYSFTPLGATEEVKTNYSIRAYPTNFLIDKNGRIAYSHFLINADNTEMLDLMIQSLVNQK
ncbi:MAG: redoxin family protein [Prolixibacteraceae bacterium]|nr:redoxin family protein [Prolixibacteraceae bacterium]